YYGSQLGFCSHRDGAGGVSARAVIAPTASVQSSILFDGSQVGAHARLRKAIVEENVRIPEGAVIGFHTKPDRRYFMMTEGGIVIVDREGVSRMLAETDRVILRPARVA